MRPRRPPLRAASATSIAVAWQLPTMSTRGHPVVEVVGHLVAGLAEYRDHLPVLRKDVCDEPVDPSEVSPPPFAPAQMFRLETAPEEVVPAPR